MSTAPWRALAQRLADTLAGEGVLRDPAWREPFANTPRHLFVPRFYDFDSQRRPNRLVTVDQDHPGGPALALAYADEALVTHYAVAGTTPDGTEVRIPTSSASMPRVVAVMLDRLNVHDGARVLEIGTGTGYHAALLCQRLGGDRVTTVELDETTAAEATEHLAAAGYQPALAVGDGAAGHASRAPYDRIIATCAVGRIPTAWLEQLSPGGRIVTPLTFGSALAVLNDDGHGGVVGRIDPELVGFMPLRGTDYQPEPVTIRRPDGVPHQSLTSVDPRQADPVGEPHDLRLWLALHLPPHANLAVTAADDGTPDGIILTTEDSYVEASYQPAEPGRWPVHQLGRCRMWDTVEAAYAAYERNGNPTRDRIGITATAAGDQYLWLDDPDGPYSWPMPLWPG